ncbi:MAG: PQQ-like beta-propeller repeat protein [Pirellulales bacterium]|nr:PQQ-like beta-propeller repeat protein [Pirellulales bacterium]
MGLVHEMPGRHPTLPGACLQPTEHATIASEFAQIAVSRRPTPFAQISHTGGVLVVVMHLVVVRYGVAQPFMSVSSRFELSAAKVGEADVQVRAQLEQARGLVANQHWDEAVETLRRVMETPGNHVVAITPARYVSLRDYCHMELASLPAAGLDLYRRRVDALAERLYWQGIESRSEDLLRQVVEQFFASSWGDEALLALGELALARADYGTSRGCWERILPPAFWAKLAPSADGEEGTARWLVYPDTNIPLGDVLARLVFLALLEGDRPRAHGVLDLLRQEHGQAEGRLAGQHVNYAEFLTNLAAASESWPPVVSMAQPTTFGGTPARHLVLPPIGDVGQVRWRISLPKAPPADAGYTLKRVAEDRNNLLSYHPLVYGRLLLVSTLYDVRAYDVHTGQPAWGDNPIVYRSEGGGRVQQRSGRSSLGAARFTLTIHADRLYARVGNPITSSGTEAAFSQRAPGEIVCLSLSEEGRLLWRALPPDEGWAFEGTPLADDERVYVGLRRSLGQPQAYVAALDAQTGRMLWRSFICRAETPAQGQEESTHHLLTLAHGTLYYNTNLGVVAAVSARDGALQWLHLYPRAKGGDLNDRRKHFYRDLNPCVYDRGVLFVAPADSPYILALDAPTGLRRWATDLPKDAVHLLGVAEGRLIASGDRLWWIDAATGRVLADFPQSEQPRGYGRGLLAGGLVYWPTQTTLYIFQQALEQGAALPVGQPVQLADAPPDQTRGAQGGNLCVAEGHLLIATSDEIIALATTSPAGVADAAAALTTEELVPPP